jgi:hypothetical protein
MGVGDLSDHCRRSRSAYAHENKSRALKEATQGRFVFLEDVAGQRTVYRLYDDYRAPSYEMFFADKGGRVTRDGTKRIFDAGRLVGSDEREEPVIKKERFEVVHQLRNLNANHALNVTGQHLSRIGGVDRF